MEAVRNNDTITITMSVQEAFRVFNSYALMGVEEMARFIAADRAAHEQYLSYGHAADDGPDYDGLSLEDLKGNARCYDAHMQLRQVIIDALPDKQPTEL